MATKTETLTIKVSPDMKNKVKQLATDKEWTVSKWLYNQLKNILDQEKQDGSSI